MFRRAALFLLGLPVLAGCGTDPGDVAVFERVEAKTAVAVGSSFDSAMPALAAKGYSCAMSSGTFVTESGAAASAPAFLACSKRTSANVGCSIHAQVVVVPEHGRVASV